MPINRSHHCLVLLLLWTFAAAGCTGHLMAPATAPQAIENKHFVIVVPGPEDTLATLATKYLGDEEKAWQIAAFNRIESTIPGQRVVIPLVPVELGGIKANGYQTVPVLLYTRIAVRPTNAHTVSAQQFENQMQYLVEGGFTTVSLGFLERFSNFREQPPPRAMVITFDTTQSWVYDIAYPLLKRRGMKGALFIRFQEIGGKGRLSWKQLSEMAADGFDIGVHGQDPDISPEKDLKKHLKALEEDLTAPQKAFKEQLKADCRFYAYPKGQSNDLRIALLKKHGYRSAFTRIRGSHPFFGHEYKIRRSVIYGHYNMDQFGRNLSTFQKADLK